MLLCFASQVGVVPGIIFKAASKARDRGQLKDAADLFIRTERWSQVFVILNDRLGQLLATQPNADRQYWWDRVRGFKEKYVDSGLILSSAPEREPELARHRDTFMVSLVPMTHSCMTPHSLIRSLFASSSHASFDRVRAACAPHSY